MESGWLGELREAPCGFSQGRDHDDRGENIVGAYKMMYRNKKGKLLVRQYNTKQKTWLLRSESQKLIKESADAGCFLLRNGKKHEVY